MMLFLLRTMRLAWSGCGVEAVSGDDLRADADDLAHIACNPRMQ